MSGTDRSGMLKVVWVCKYQPTWDRERGHRYWRTHHANLGRRVPLMPWYQQNLVVEAVGPRGVLPATPPAADGFSLCWFQDRETFARCVASPELQAMDRDAATIFEVGDMWGGWSASLEERVTAHVATPEEELFKVSWIARRAPGTDGEGAWARWTGEHVALLNAVPGLLRHAQSRALEGIGADGLAADLPLAFDAIAEFWFADRPSYVRAMRSPEWDAVLADAARFLDLDAVWSGGYAGVIDHLWINEPNEDRA